MCSRNSSTWKNYLHATAYLNLFQEMLLCIIYPNFYNRNILQSVTSILQLKKILLNNFISTIAIFSAVRNLLKKFCAAPAYPQIHTIAIFFCSMKLFSVAPHLHIRTSSVDCGQLRNFATTAPKNRTPHCCGGNGGNPRSWIWYSLAAHSLVTFHIVFNHISFETGWKQVDFNLELTNLFSYFDSF
jgi:hypothetical protein